jgi:hypothetical protein
MHLNTVSLLIRIQKYDLFCTEQCKAINLERTNIDFKYELNNHYHVNWIICIHGTARSQVEDGGDILQIWRVTELGPILNY